MDEESSTQTESESATVAENANLVWPADLLVTYVQATGVVTLMLPSFRSVRTYALMLVRSRNSKGICAVITSGETRVSGARTPSKYTCVLANVVGSVSASAGAVAVPSLKLPPSTLTSVPGAILAASCPPESVAPPAAQAPASCTGGKAAKQ